MDWSHPFYNNSQGNQSPNIRNLGDIRIVGADRKPCPVCGHPTGDCGSGDTPLPNTAMPSQMNGTEPMILVESDITEERSITPYTKTRVLIHRKGDYVPLSRARELGLVK